MLIFAAMEKLQKIKEIGESLEFSTDYYYGNSYSDIIKTISFLIDAKDNGATHIKFKGVTEYDNSSNLEELTIQPISIELESDSDLLNRLQKEEDAVIAKQSEAEQAERAYLAFLKQKYEK